MNPQQLPPGWELGMRVRKPKCRTPKRRGTVVGMSTTGGALHVLWDGLISNRFEYVDRLVVIDPTQDK